MSERSRYPSRKSPRANWWDYSRNGSYFITICTKNQIRFFGQITNGIMYPSEIGIIAEKHWNEIPERFPFIFLGAYIVMPDHIHGILTIQRDFGDVRTRLIASVHPQNRECISDPQNRECISDPQNWEGIISDPQNINGIPSHLNKRGGITGIHNPMLHENLSRVIRWFTGRVSYEIHKIEPEFCWHGRFHDRIIRNEIEYRLYTRYIYTNPKNWKGI